MVRWRHSLQAKLTSYVSVAVLCFSIFLLTQLLSSCLTDFYRIFTKRRRCSISLFQLSVMVTPWKLVPTEKKQKNWRSITSIFLAKIQTLPYSDSRCVGMRRNSGKTKTTGITTISRLSSHPHIGEIWFGGIWANVPQHFIRPCNISKMATHTE